jgi:uncharacterized protein YegJ (DUF2314 family)
LLLAMKLKRQTEKRADAMPVKKVLIPVVDGVEQNKLHPDTFHIPSESEKCNVKPLDFVKAGFDTGEDEIVTERMWVVVASIKDGVIRGALANEPFMSRKGKLGDPVRMEFRHILAIEENR